MKRRRMTEARKTQIGEWLGALQAGADANRERVNQNLEAGRVWTEERRAAWKAQAASAWTPAKREAARQRAVARHAANKAMRESKHDENATR